VPGGGSATIETAPTTTNVFGRITGASPSQIDGTLTVQNSANFFLLNPNGITFGPNASLNIGGSFVATTADRVVFEDGGFFSATEPHPLLSVKLPIGLQFGANPGAIINQTKSFEQAFPVGLRGSTGTTLALIGTDVTLDGGSITTPGGINTLFSPGGNIEIGSVDSGSLVGLELAGSNLGVNYNGVQRFADITLTNGAIVSSGGASSGAIRLQGRNIRITDRSEITALNFGSAPGRAIEINASELVQLDNLASIQTAAFSINPTADVVVGAAGNIMINAQRLLSGLI
jgi:filamentous hemagglutinin family protein